MPMGVTNKSIDPIEKEKEIQALELQRMARADQESQLRELDEQRELLREEKR